VPDPIEAAARALARGRLVVYPTDTLWGLGARATDAAAVDRLFALKERPPDMPVSLAVSSLEEIEPLVRMLPAQRAFVRRELPGPITVLLPPSPAAKRRLAPALLGPGRSIGVRIPDHPVARELARRAGPITCTSANKHGRTPPPDLEGVRAELGDGVAAYLDGPPAPSGKPSRIIDLTGAAPAVVRG
jgi:L-threonylcarbamoyladenylate synthase